MPEVAEHAHPVLEGYCVKCKAKHEMLHVQERIVESRGGGRRQAVGKCKACGTTICKILPSTWPKN